MNHNMWKKFDDYKRGDPTRFDSVDEATKRRKITIGFIVIGACLCAMLISAPFMVKNDWESMQCTCTSTVPWPVPAHIDEIGNVSATLHHKWEAHQIKFPGDPFVVRVKTVGGTGARARLLVERFRMCGNEFPHRVLRLLTINAILPPLPKCVVVLVGKMPSADVLYHIHTGVVVFVSSRSHEEDEEGAAATVTVSL